MRKAFSRSSGRIRLVALLTLALCGTIPLWLWADAPAWWAQRGVLNTSMAPDDYAVVNQGQVKHIAKKAYEEFTAKLPGGAGGTLAGIWASPAASTDDYQAINLGQLKTVAKPFYDRLHAAGYTGQPLTTGQVYPWDGATSADDYALANIGQVKNLFSFIIPDVAVDPNDTDGNGLLDSWELQHFGAMGGSAAADSDGDGVSNLAEFTAGTDPLSQNNNAVQLTLFAPSAR